MSDENPSPVPFKVASAILKKPLTFSELRSTVALLATVVGAAFFVYFHIENKASAQVDAGMRARDIRIEALESSQRSTNEEIHLVKLDVNATKAEVKEVAVDVRALYRFVRTGQRQERLEDAGGPP